VTGTVTGAGRVRRCPAGHDLPGSAPARACRCCRRDRLVTQVATVETSLPQPVIAAAVEAVTATSLALSRLTAALHADPAALARGAPPLVGRLVLELVAAGSTVLRAPACVACAKTGTPLTATDTGGMCSRCRHRHTAAACARCGQVKPVAGRTDTGQPWCETCRRRERGHRPCGTCGATASIAIRGRGGNPDVCVNCYRLPDAVCTGCGRRRPCIFAGTDHPTCKTCTPRATATCARCRQQRPPAARWPEGPVCDPCYTAALRHRDRCTGCGQTRRLVAPPGLHATTCADCAGIPPAHQCADCGIEDKLYERARCVSCSLRRRATALLSAGTGRIPDRFTDLFTAITTTPSPRTALNWLRQGAGAALLADLSAGRLPLTHQALDTHPRPAAADYLRHMLIAGGVLPRRDEDLARTERWLADLLAGLDDPAHRPLLAAYASWRVIRRLRRRAEHTTGPRTYTATARNNIKAAAAFLTWLTTRHSTVDQLTQRDIDTYLTTGPGAWQVRDFLTWTAQSGHSPRLHASAPGRVTGPAADPTTWQQTIRRLLHEHTLDPGDRLAGTLLALFAQQLSRITALTTDHITHTGGSTHIRLGHHTVPLPEPLTACIHELLAGARIHHSVGSPTTTNWLFPGHHPGRPITAYRLGQRLHALGIDARTHRRAALTHLGAHLPAAVLADLTGIHPTTAVRWTHSSAADWATYAADLTQTPDHQA
jgi:hypothetical protein